MGPQGLADVAVEGGQVHQVLFAALLGEGLPCMVLLLPRVLRVYSLCGYGGAPPRGPGTHKAPEEPLRFLCEMHLGAPILHAAVIPCSGRGGSGGFWGHRDACCGDPPSEDGPKGSPCFPTGNHSASGGACVSCRGSRGPPDMLLLLFGEYRAVVCYYDADSGALATLSMHSFAELGPRAAAVNSYLMGPPHIKLADEGLSSDTDDGAWGLQGAPTVAAGQLPVSALRPICKAHVFDLEHFNAGDSLGAPLRGAYGTPRDPSWKEFLALLSVDVLHVVCLHLSLKTEMPLEASAAATASSAAAPQGDGAFVGSFSPHVGAHGGLCGGPPRNLEGPSQLLMSPGMAPLYTPSFPAATAAPAATAVAASAGKRALPGVRPLASPWSPDGGPSPIGAPYLPGKGPLGSPGTPFSQPPGSLSTIPPVAFLAAAVQRQQQQQQQAADELGSLGEASGGSAASESGDGVAPPSLWGTHKVLGQGLSVSSCFFLSLVEDIPLPPSTAAAIAAAAAPGAAAVAGDASAPAAAAAAAAATAAAVTAGAAGLPYVLLDMVGVSSLLFPAAALLLAEGPRELGLLPFAGTPGSGEVFALLLAIHPEERDIKIIAKIPSLLGDTFRLLSVPAVAEGVLCLSPDSVSFLSFGGGHCGGGGQRLVGLQQQQQQDCNSRTAGVTHILHPAGLVRKDLVQLPSVVFDKSNLRLRLDGAAATFLRDKCLLLLAADGRPALAHLVIPAGMGVTDFLWTSVELFSPRVGHHLGVSSQVDSQGPHTQESLSGQLLLPRSDSLAVWPVGAPSQQAVSLGNFDSCSSCCCLVAFGGRVREGTGVCLAVAEPQLVLPPRKPWGVPPGASRDLHCSVSSLFTDVSTATGAALLETCCSLVPELQQGKGQQQQQQQQQQQELYTTDGKQLIEIFPDGSVDVAQQMAPILRHAELQEEEGFLSVAADADAAPLSSPLGYLRWLRMQQGKAAAPADAASDVATEPMDEAPPMNGKGGLPLPPIAAAVAALNSSSSSQHADYPMVDALGMVKGSGGPPLLPSFRFLITDRLNPQGLAAPRCVAYLPLPPIDRPTAAPVQQEQEQQQALTAFCNTSGGSRFITAGGVWPHGALGALQRSVPCRPLAAVNVAEGSPRIIWALQQQQQQQQQHELQQQQQQQQEFLLVSSDPRMGLGETRLLSLRNGDLVDETEAAAAGDSSSKEKPGGALSFDVPTLFAASLLGGLVVLQLTAEELRVLSSFGGVPLCSPVDMSEVRPPEQQGSSTSLSAAAEETPEESHLLQEDGTAKGRGPTAMDVDTEKGPLPGPPDAAEDMGEYLPRPSADWEREKEPLSGGLSAAMRGSAAHHWICVVLDDFRLRIWKIDAAAAAAAAAAAGAAEGEDAPSLDVGIGISSFQQQQHKQTQLLQELAPAAIPCCMRGRVKSAQLYVHPKGPLSGCDEGVDGEALDSVEVFCCVVTLEGPNGVQALHLVSLQQMRCLFSSVDLRLVSPILRNCGSCAQLQLQQLLQQQEQQLIPPPALAAGASSSRSLVSAAPSGAPSPLEGVLRSPADQDAAREGPPQGAGAAAARAAAAALAEEGLRDARRAVTCVAVAPLPLSLPADDTAGASAAAVDTVAASEAAAAGDTVEASEATAPEEVTEEVLSAELVLLDPAGDTGPTLVVFITGRPPLIYRAFPAAAYATAVFDRNGLFPTVEKPGEIPDASAAGCALLAPQNPPPFPWAFRLVPHSCTDCIPSLQGSAAEPSVHFAVSSGYTTVPQQVSLWGGGVALVVPPLPLPNAAAAEQQKLMHPPVLWLCSNRNQLYVHPNERRDAVSAASFRWQGGPPGSFAFLYGWGPSVCLSDIAGPFDRTCCPPQPSAAVEAADGTPKNLGPFRLDGPLPFSSFQLGTSATHVAVSSGSSYVLPFQCMSDVAAAPPPPPGRLVAVAVHHPTEETEQIKQVLETRNALQKAHLALQSRAGAAAAAGGGDARVYEESGGLSGVSPTAGSDGPGGGLLPNPYLSACTDGRVEVEGEVGRQHEVLLFHQDNLQCPLGSFLLGPCEEVMSLQFVTLDALEFLAVGVGQLLSEGVDAGGRLLLLRLPPLLSYGHAAAASGDLVQEGEGFGLFCSFVFGGPVSAVGDFAPSAAERHYLLHSVGRRLFIHEMDGDLLARGAFADVGTAITSVSTLKQFIVTGDLYRGICLLAWRFDSSSDSRRLELVSRTIPHWLLPVTACDALTEGDALGILAGDPWGNLRIFSLNQTNDVSSPVLQQLQVLRCDSESMESDAPIVAFKQLLTEKGDVACAAWSAEGSLLSLRLVDEETAVLLRELQGWLETCLPTECGLSPTAARVPAGPPSLHLRLWVAEQQQQLQQQLQQLLLQQYRAQDEDTTTTAAAVAAASAGETVDACLLLQQLEGKALAALRSRIPLSASLLRSFAFLSLPVQQRLVAAATPSLLSLLKRHFGVPSEGSGGASFSWDALRAALAGGALRGLDLPAVPSS